MLTLDDKDRHYIREMIVHKFNLKDQKNIEKYCSLLQDLLNQKNKNLFFELQCLTYFHNNPLLTNNIFLIAFSIYRYLRDKSSDPSVHTYLDAIFLDFHVHIFHQRCKERQKNEKRSETVQSVLKHVTKNLNTMLDTQQLMIANISHEMRTSLNTITGYLSLLEQQGGLNSDARKFLSKSLKASDSLNTLVSDILSISKLNAGQMELNYSYFWLDDVILHSIDNITMQLEKKHLTFKSNVTFFPYQVYGDAQRVMEILTNLLTNAVKFTNSGLIELTIEKREMSDDTVTILFRVKDSGIGMTQEQIESIFDPYVRHNDTIHGLGLGLYISRKLAQKMGGDLVVSSIKDEGSTFEFSITLRQKFNQNLHLKGKKVYFLSELNDPVKKEVSNDKVKLLKELGVDIKEFYQEEDFTKYLLGGIDNKKDGPDIISIATTPDKYTKYDSLINYLKNFEKYRQTYFIGEQTISPLSVNFFDKTFEYFATLSTYIEFLNKKDVYENNVVENKKIHILAVDDIETNLDLLQIFIHKKYPSVKIDMALGGYEAVGMYKVNNYDLVFLDIKMPGLDGFKVLEKLRTIKEPSKVYALTADVYKETFDRVMGAGFDGLLEKPFKLNTLYQVIEKVAHV